MVSRRWKDAHSERPRSLVRLRLWHGTLLVVTSAPRTSSIAFPFVLEPEQLSDTPSRAIFDARPI